MHFVGVEDDKICSCSRVRGRSTHATMRAAVCLIADRAASISDGTDSWRRAEDQRDLQLVRGPERVEPSWTQSWPLATGRPAASICLIRGRPRRLGSPSRPALQQQVGGRIGDKAQAGCGRIN
jgi:hypothetical protein